MIDTHTHLYMSDSFPDGGEAAVSRAVESGVEMMVLPAVDRESVDPLISLHRKCPAHTAVALGLHPTELEQDWRAELREILDRGEGLELVAIGETGIDLYWEKKFLTRQMDAFGEQIQAALDRNLPVIIHSRDATEETAQVVRSFGSTLPPLVFHSFTSGIADAEKLLEAAPEAFFGINGVITFKNANPLREAVAWLDPSRLVLETDAPFLAPVPHRGKTNESSFLSYVAKALAAEKGIAEEEIKRITTENATRLYPSLRGATQT